MTQERKPLIISTISTFRNYGTTNFFRALVEYNTTGVVILGATHAKITSIEFRLKQQYPTRSIQTITQFLRSKALQEEVKNAKTGGNSDIFICQDVRCELEKVDYRSRSTARVFSVRESYTPIFEGSTASTIETVAQYYPEYKVIEYVPAITENYEAMEEVIKEAIQYSQLHASPTDEVQGF